jgi:hypothetical protein
MDKIKSRKLWATIIAAIANAVIPVLCPAAIPALPAINKLVAVYVGAQGITDAVSALAGGQ